ncbi:MAG: SDR family oxidoreductase [Bacteroidota bacterium]
MAEDFFVTGGTGLVGLFLIPRLLRKFPSSHITLLVRAENDAEARARTAAIAGEVAREDGVTDASQRIRGVRGDVMHDRLGLSPKEFDRLLAETTYIVHGAATIRFDHPIEEAREVNCGGTRRMLAIAEQCEEGGRLKRFVYIGTSSVSGRRAGIVTEDELEMGQEFFNTYEQSKAEAERIVRNHFERIPAVVFRPSIIIGDSRTGRTTSFNVIYIPLRLVQRGLLDFVPGTPDTTMDLVPIDWVDDVIVHILEREEANGRVFHVTAGPQRAAPLGEVVLSATEYFDRHTPLAHPRRMEFVTREEFERRRQRTRGREEALLSQLDTLLPYTSINRLFDSRNTDALLEGSGIEFPRFNTYAERIFSYCVRTNWGKRPG